MVICDRSSSPSNMRVYFGSFDVSTTADAFSGSSPRAWINCTPASPTIDRNRGKIAVTRLNCDGDGNASSRSHASTSRGVAFTFSATCRTDTPMRERQW
jgi:hypothetical protein